MAAARAEARRKAILARGNDRLAKLTTSARGEDAPAFVPDERPALRPAAAVDSFLGEEPSLPSIPASRASHPASRTTSGSLAPDAAATNDPSAWTPAQQEQFMRALMESALTGTPPTGTTPTIEGRTSTAGPDANDPFMALMQSFTTAQGKQGAPNADSPSFSMPPGMPVIPGMGIPGAGVTTLAKPKTLAQKLFPLLHLLFTFVVLVYFVLYKEVGAFAIRAGASVSHEHDGLGESQWRRWAELARRPSDVGGWGVQAVTFFPVFLAVEIALYSLRIMSGFDAVQPPMLLSLALPHLPSPIPSLIMNGMKYARMLSVILDDIAGLVVALGLTVWIAGLISG